MESRNWIQVQGLLFLSNLKMRYFNFIDLIHPLNVFGALIQTFAYYLSTMKFQSTKLIIVTLCEFPLPCTFQLYHYITSIHLEITQISNLFQFLPWNFKAFQPENPKSTNTLCKSKD